MESNYSHESPRLLKDFEKFTRIALPVLSDRFGDGESGRILKLTRDRFEGIIPDIPYIGGKKNQFSEELETGAMTLALYFVLKEQGLTTEQIGKLNYDIFEAIYSKTPSLVLSFMKRFAFSRFSRRKFKQASERSQLREYSDDWVVEYLDGKDDEYDIGLDFTQCALCRFYETQGAFEFAKYMCLIDYIPSKMIDSGLERSQTIAEGAERCDFRYKKGRPVRPRWPTPV
ncbi:MAG: L-2-amino-thiazoline-4-carboxylic acid hydrolase [Candidatus Thorarchaeota archaeon]